MSDENKEGEEPIRVGPEIEYDAAERLSRIKRNRSGLKDAVSEHVESPRQNELLPCPFCGDARVEIVWEPCDPITANDTNRIWFAECENCGAQGPVQNRENRCAAPWNKREPLSDDVKAATIKGVTWVRDLLIAKSAEGPVPRWTASLIHHCKDIQLLLAADDVKAVEKEEALRSALKHPGVAEMCDLLSGKTKAVSDTTQILQNALRELTEQVNARRYRGVDNQQPMDDRFYWPLQVCYMSDIADAALRYVVALEARSVGGGTEEQGAGAAPVTPKSESAWLVEKGEVSAPDYLCIHSGQLTWTKLHMQATRFGRKIDAEKAITGFCDIEDIARICQHSWESLDSAI